MKTIQPCNLPCPLSNGRHAKASIFGIETPENMFAQRYLPQYDDRYVALHVKDGVLVGVEMDDGTPETETMVDSKTVESEQATDASPMNRTQLITALKAKGLKANGTVSELQARLQAAK
jgi:hypothetical protein